MTIPRIPVRRAGSLLALGCAATGLTIAVACSSFAGGSEGPPDEAGADAPLVDGPAPDAGGDGDPSSPACGTFTGEPQTLATGEDAPTMVAADLVHVYWGTTTAGVIRRANVVGAGKPIDFVAADADAGGPKGLVLTNRYVVWKGRTMILARDKQQPFPTGQNVAAYPFDNADKLVAMNGDAVGFARTADVFSVDVTTTTPFPEVVNQSGVSALAYGGASFAYLAAGVPGVGVYLCDVPGADCKGDGGTGFFAAGVADARAIVADSNSVYWVEAQAGKVRRLKKSAGAKPEELVTGLVDPFAIVLDKGSVYVATISGGIARAPKDGPACAVTPKAAAVTSLAESGDYVYFTEGSSVLRIRK